MESGWLENGLPDLDDLTNWRPTGVTGWFVIREASNRHFVGFSSVGCGGNIVAPIGVTTEYVYLRNLNFVCFEVRSMKENDLLMRIWIDKRELSDQIILDVSKLKYGFFINNQWFTKNSDEIIRSWPLYQDGEEMEDVDCFCFVFANCRNVEDVRCVLKIKVPL